MSKKTIVITGSTKGIGYGLALEFLKSGHQIIINGRNEDLLNSRLKELKSQGYDLIAVPGNISDENVIQSIIDHAKSEFGKIDIWINNAGIPQSQRYFYELEKEEIDNIVSVNIVGVMIATRMLIRLFKKQGYGKIFNMEGFGSDGRIMNKLTLYGTSKRAVNYFTKSVSKEIKDEGIQIGILSPGMVRTDFLLNSSSTGDLEEQERNKRVFDILAEDVDIVTKFLVRKILKSHKNYDRIEYLTKRRLIPKLFKLMFVK